MPNPFVYVQLQTPDITRSKDFYAAIFEWQFEDTSNAQVAYLELQVGDGTSGGMLLVVDEQRQATWVPYILVDDIIEVVRTAESLDAVARQPLTEIPGQRWYAVLQDPSGAIFAVMQPIKTPIGE